VRSTFFSVCGKKRREKAVNENDETLKREIKGETSCFQYGKLQIKEMQEWFRYEKFEARGAIRKEAI